jgi:acyl dehydratase
MNDVQVGDELPPFQRATGFHNWNRYAAVNDEFVPIHMDDEAGRAAGYPTAFGMGNLQWSYLHNMLRNWAGDDGRILRLSCQFRGPNTKGQTVTAHGTVSAIRQDEGQRIVDLEVWTEDQHGAKLAPGTATVALGD